MITTRVSVELDVPARMRDGVTLRANVYRPEGQGPWPTLLTRTPYGKDVLHHFPHSDPVQAARDGFLVAVQDTRGRFASEGAWEPFRYEREDGYDSVEWVAGLPGSNGRVGMYGDSYVGNTQWLAAAEQPPSLRAIAPAFTWTDPMNGLFARGGAVELGLALPWSLLHNVSHVERASRNGAPHMRRGQALLDEYDRMSRHGYWQLPVWTLEALKRHGIAAQSLLRGAYDQSFAQRCTIDPADVLVPTLHTVGWYDVFQQETLDSYQAMVARGHEARLVIGPWTHIDFADPIGERHFGVRAGRYGSASNQVGDVNDLQLAWFKRHLLSDAAVELPDAPIRIFVMGRNVWRDEMSWPPSRAVDEPWFLGRGGTLARAKPQDDDVASEFLYDPEDPVPSVGGATILAPELPAGPRDQRLIEARRDVLVFTSAPLEADLEVTGRVRVVLYAESSAPSTDWVARLCDVALDGRSFVLCDGIVRVFDDARAVRRYEIDLWSTSNVFRRGHRIRVHVTSSSFPRWDRNLNTGDQTNPTTAVAQQRVYHDPARPSHVLLPSVR